MTTDAAMARIDPVSATMSPARTVLMIAYAFPPEAYVGGRRTLKYCKYLGQFGWRSIVVTIKPRPDAFQDESLSRQLPPDVVVLRTHSRTGLCSRPQDLRGCRSVTTEDAWA